MVPMLVVKYIFWFFFFGDGKYS